MKNLIIIILILALIIIFAACYEPTEKQETVERFVLIYYQYGYKIVYDKETGVEYIVYHQGTAAGMTPLYNADGTIKVYEEVEE